MAWAAKKVAGLERIADLPEKMVMASDMEEA
jgi:hypothetical protein